MADIIPRPNLKNLLSIAFPMVVSQGAETIMLWVDRWFLSGLDKVNLSAAMSGGLSAFVFTSFFTGMIGYTNAIAAQYYGSGKKENCSITCAQGVRLSLLVYPLMLLLILPVKFLFSGIGHTPAQVNLEYSYYSVLMLGSVFAVLRSAFVGFFLGTGRTKIVMKANIIGMLVNVPINYLLIFGHLGFPKLGIIGAAIGTICGSFIITLILFLNYISQRFNQEFKTRIKTGLNRIIMKKLLRFGTPAGIELFMNVFAFNVFVLLMHSYSENVAAAVTITFNYDLLAFIPMIGIGVATTAIVGQQLGAGRKKDAEKAVYLALKVAYSYAAIMMILFVLIPGQLANVFAVSFSSTDRAEIIPLAKLMLRLAAIYTLADATQLVFSGALRGAGDTKWVMWISGILHYIMAGTAIVLIKVVKLRPEIVWIFFIFFILSLGFSIFIRFRLGKWKNIELINTEKTFYGLLAENYEHFFPLDKNQLAFVEQVSTKDRGILDIGCATGALVSALTEKGFSIEGIDPDEDMISHGCKLHPGASISEAFLNEFAAGKQTKQFGTVCCLGNTLPHLGSVSEIEKFFEQVYGLLENDGIFISQFINFDRFNADGDQLQQIMTEEHILKRDYSGKAPIIFKISISSRSNGKSESSTVELLPISAEQIKKLLQKTGFTDIQVYKDYDKTEYDQKAVFALITARK